MPQFVVSDLSRPRVTALVLAGGACWLTGRALTTGLGGELVELDIIAAAPVVFVPTILLIGPRTIRIDESGIHVTRRGRLVLSRRLDEIAGLRGFLGTSRLVFRDGAWLQWNTTGPEWGPPTDFLVERLGGTRQRGALSLPARRVRFPAVCLGCGAAPEVEVAITARRGVNLLLGSFFVQRDIPAPACRRCRSRRRALAGLLSFGPPIGLVACAFVPLLTPLKGAPVAVIAGVLALAIVVLVNRGAEWGDAWIWGVRGGLARDGTVHLRCRDPALTAAIAANSLSEETCRPAAPARQVLG